MKPDYVLALASRGDVYRCQKKFALALDDLTEALKLNPKRIFALTTRGEVYSLKGQFEKAKRDFSEALRLDPSNQFALEKLKLLNPEKPV